jgi:predicted GIY-YIG superfamily endonuclease
VPDVAVRVVPTKAAEAKAMEEFLRGRATKSYTAIDEVQNGTQWERANERVTARLNKGCYEYDVCKLYVNAVVRMTYNRRQEGVTVFSQGQVAVVVALPEDGVDFNDQRLTLKLAPPGIRQIDPDNMGDDWREILVGPRTGLPVPVGSSLQLGRRRQLPVRYFLASTLHRCQGHTVPLLATEMSLSKKEYKMWQREQFAVLISRVQRCQDIIFVGDQQETRAAIEHILRQSSKWDALVEHYLTELNVALRPSRARRIVLDVHPFLPMYRELPSASCGCAYMLVSMARASRVYIGETRDLKVSLRRHNTGYGAPETMNTGLQPWGVYAFVYNFEENTDDEGRESRKDFAQQWSYGVTWERTADQVYEFGLMIADEWLKERGSSLVVVKCGQSPSTVSR